MELDYNQLIEQALTIDGAIGTTYSRFYNYSITNQYFFMLQGITEPVANFNTWRKLGRYPKKNTAKLVITPVPLYEKNKDGEKEQSGCYFRLKKAVFAYSDTFGDELEIPEVTAIDWTIERAEQAINIERVPFESTNGNSHGYSHGRKYAINPMATYPLKTTMHELAHIVLNHTSGFENHERSTAEFQAEATAYILMNEFQSEEWNKDASRAYIQNWLDGEKPSESDIKAVFVAVNKILNAGKVVENE